jgi:hypothetical protein
MDLGIFYSYLFSDILIRTIHHHPLLLLLAFYPSPFLSPSPFPLTRPIHRII